MTIESILLAGIGALSTAIIFLFGMVREQTRRCEAERRELLGYIIEIAKLLPPDLKHKMLHIPGMGSQNADQ